MKMEKLLKLKKKKKNVMNMKLLMEKNNLNSISWPHSQMIKRKMYKLPYLEIQRFW